MNKKRRTRTFRRELMVSFTGVAVIPFLLCCVLLIQVFTAQADMKNNATQTQVETDLVYKLDDVMDSLERLSERIAGNVKLSQALVKENEEEYLEMIYTELYKKTSKYRDYAVFELYDMDGVLRFSTDSVTEEYVAPTYWGILNKALANPYSMVYSRGGIASDDKDTVLSFARVIIPYDRATGYFVMRISRDKFGEILQEAFSKQLGVEILDEYLNPIYEAGIVEDGSFSNIIRTRYLGGAELSEDYGDNRVSIASLSKEKMYVAVIMPKTFSADTIRLMYRILGAFALLLVIISATFAVMMARGFSKPITQMREQMREVRKGNLDVEMDTNWKNEFSDLANSFNHMTKELKEYMNLQVEQQKELNGTQIAMMQAQLNPHFLYNTLDTMKWVAKANHVPELVTLVSKLSKILRASISKEQFVTLKSEMELVESYAEIQKIRFDGKFECICEYPPELEDVYVPKLVVQPIVENSVIHGFESAENGHIYVVAQTEWDETKEKDILVIKVADDGRGITDEELSRLELPDADEKKGHIGVRNVKRIIELNYGTEYGLTIQKGPEKGTIVKMTFPIVGNVKTGDLND